MVICEYLEDASAFDFTAPHLLPLDPWLRARARLWIEHANRAVVPAFFKLLQTRPEEPQPEGQVAALEEWREALGTICAKKIS